MKTPKAPTCRTCGESIFDHLYSGRTRICVAPIPEGFTRQEWVGSLTLRIQQKKKERWSLRHANDDSVALGHHRTHAVAPM